jgi:hypothetical protein
MMQPFRAPRKAKELAIQPERESEAPTELGVVQERHIIKETDEEVANRRGGYELWANVRGDKETGEEWEARIDKENMERGGSKWSMDKERALAEEDYFQHELSKVQSSCLSEFEAYLDKIDAQRKHSSKDDSEYESTCEQDKDAEQGSGTTSRERTDAWWESVLERGKKRCEDDTNSRTVDVEDILLNEGSDDDDVPIVATLPPKTSNLSLLAMAASKKRAKKASKTLWAYETVAEPTGVVSKYWDSPAPMERATKRAAKQKLRDFTLAEPDVHGKKRLHQLPFHNNVGSYNNFADSRGRC